MNVFETEQKPMRTLCGTFRFKLFQKINSFDPVTYYETMLTAGVVADGWIWKKSRSIHAIKFSNSHLIKVLHLYFYEHRHRRVNNILILALLVE